ncbi:type II secretion system F family protein [Agromyces sp. Marseille-Q5079]|uniref:type II secretion system F family protein n=1 Tax=Agromyces sp. Marseille-Q5079 TaxID=3439059 RepID=UPI003D9CBC0C
MSPLLLVAGLAFGLLALFVLIFLVIAAPAPRVAKDRRRAPGVEEVSALTKLTERTTEVIERVSARRSRRLFGAEELELAGVKTEPSGFIVLVAAASGALAVLGALLGLANGSAFLLAMLFALLGPVGAKVVLIMRTSKRRAKFADQIDDTVQLMAGSLRAGHGLTRSLVSVANDADSPMREELARVVNETRLGRDLASSLAFTAQRMHSADFEWVAQAIAINQETGGNLAEVLDQVGRTIRERSEIRRHVAGLSAEGRLSGVILIVLPIGVALFIGVTQPGYFAAFFESIIGIAALVVAAILLVVGSVWMSFAVKVKF